jgi:non-specific protein-tyrosine kinase
MEVLLYWRLILQNKVLLVVCIFLGLLASIGLTLSATPMYKSESQVFVSTPVTSLDISALATGSSFSQQRVKSYAQIVNSPLTLRAVIEELGLNISAEELSKRVSASAPLDTVLISISVNDSSPLRAAEIANEIATQFKIVASDLEMRSIDTDAPVKISTVRLAVPAEAPFTPRTKINYILGIVFGFAMGLLVSGVRKVLDLSVKNEDDLSGLPLLSAIGFDSAAEEKPLITELGRYAARTESFRNLRTNVKYIVPNIPAKIIAVTSALPNEGKSTTAINLSISMAQGGQRVLLIEGDMRRPQLCNYLNLAKSELGLSTILNEKKKISVAAVNRVVQQFEETRLDLITSGPVPSNPSELLGSSRMNEFLKVLRGMYDYIIFDTPPLLPVTDAAVVASQVDGVILVVHAGKTKKPQFQGCRAAVESVNGRILGVVLNKIPEKAAGYNYGYKYSYSPGYGIKAEKAVATEYAPSPEEKYRIEREEFFERVVGKRFKEELSREVKKYDRL